MGNGRITPTVSLLERLAKGLEIDPYQLYVFGHEKKKSSKPLRLVPDGAQEQSLLQVFLKISREDRSLLLYMARQMAGRPEGASKEVGENHDEQARPSESGQEAAGPSGTIPLGPDGTGPAERVSGQRVSVASPEWAKRAGEEVEAREPR